MALSNRRRALFAKIETTYGVDAVPVAATDAVLIRSIDVTPLDVQYTERSLVRGFMGAFEQLVTGQMVKLSLELEAVGFGTAGPAAPTPGYDALLRGCALARTITAGTKVDYTPVSTGHESLTCYFYQDGTLHKLLGARGTLGLSLRRNEIPVWRFEYWGLYGGVTDAAFPAPVLSAFQRPEAASLAATTLAKFLGANATGICLESLEINLNNEVIYRNLINCTESILITDRKPSGSAEIEAVTVATRDIYTLVKNATLGDIDYTHGSTTGKKLRAFSTRVQPTSPRFGESDQIVMLPLDLLFIPNTGNDEITFSIL